MIDDETHKTESQEKEHETTNEIFIKIEIKSEDEIQDERNIEGSTCDDVAIELEKRKKAFSNCSYRQRQKTFKLPKPPPKTTAERSKAYRERLKILKSIESTNELAKSTTSEPQKTAAEHSKAYREPQKALKEELSEPSTKPKRKTGAERIKAYRERLKILKSIELANAESPTSNDVNLQRETAAEHSKAYRERQTALKQQQPQPQANSTKKTAAERSKAYRERLKILKSIELANELAESTTSKPTRKTTSEYCRAYKERQKTLKKLPNPSAKTGAERSRAHREKKKMLTLSSLVNIPSDELVEPFALNFAEIAAKNEC